MPQLAYLAGCLAFPPLFGLFLPRHYLLAATGALTLLLAGLLVTALAYNESLFHGIFGSPQRAARMAVNEATRTAGFVAGASGGGLLLQGSSFHRTLLITAAAILTATTVQALLVLRLPGLRRR